MRPSRRAAGACCAASRRHLAGVINTSGIAPDVVPIRRSDGRVSAGVSARRVAWALPAHCLDCLGIAWASRCRNAPAETQSKPLITRDLHRAATPESACSRSRPAHPQPAAASSPPAAGKPGKARQSKPPTARGSAGNAKARPERALLQAVILA